MTDGNLSGIPNKKPKRHRATKSGLIDRRAVLLEIVRDAQPATVRQIFYLASVCGIVTKDEGGYSRVQIDLVDMRRSGQLPYGWIVDHTRWQQRPVTSVSIDEALADTAATYRKALWRDAHSYIEIWLEKDALSGVVFPVTAAFDVPLMVARGYASETFLQRGRRLYSCLPEAVFHLPFRRLRSKRPGCSEGYRKGTSPTLRRTPTFISSASR